MDRSFNYREISKTLSTSGAVKEEDLLGLSKSGYRSVINLLPGSHEKALKDERKIVEDQGLSYFHIPVDFGNPTNEDYELFKQVLLGVEQTKVHIHCAANWRVSAFYGVYACEMSIWSAQQAWEHITSIWSPTEYPVWLHFLRGHGVVE